MDELTVGMGDEQAGDGKTGTPHAMTEANAFMDERSEVHGVGIGATEEGERCIVLFADRIPSDAVPASLDGMPVRVHDSDGFSTQPTGGD